MCELLQYGEEGIKPELERASISAHRSAEQGKSFAMMEWVDILENGAGAGVAADPAKARDMLARALSAEFKTEQKNRWMTTSRSATVI
jgi:hypothetical protein